MIEIYLTESGNLYRYPEGILMLLAKVVHYHIGVMS